MLKRRAFIRRNRGRFAPYLLGRALLALGATMVGFSFYAILLKEAWLGFCVAAVAAGLLGWGLTWWGSSDANPSKREALIAVLMLWLLMPAFGALPYAVSGGMSVLNAYFESMSGFTTTGATVLRDFSSFSQSLFMWRSLTQWIGGVGIIVLFIAVLPTLAIAGRQLFFTEAPGPTEEKLSPRLRNTASSVLWVYIGFTMACAFAYWMFGMTPFDAVAHAFTTLAAGGFSPNGLSFEGFSPALSWVCTFFMFFAGANFALLYRAIEGRPKQLLGDPEFRAYVVIILVAALAMSALLLGVYAPAAALRHGFFQTLSILTTAGYASADFSLWPLPALTPLVLLMFIGGSAGSAGGGIKIVRWLMLLQNTRREVQRTLHPRGVFPVRLGTRTVPEPIMRAVSAFITLYILVFALTTGVLVLLGSDFVTAFSAAIACIGNIGPGLEQVGPMANFADLHPLSRALLIFCMYAGRLEIVTVFVIFDPYWWRLPQGVFRGK